MKVKFKYNLEAIDVNTNEKIFIRIKDIKFGEEDGVQTLTIHYEQVPEKKQ